MINRLSKVFPWLLGIIIIANLVFLDFMLANQKRSESLAVVSVPSGQPEKETTAATISCTTCQSYIQGEVAKQVAAIPTKPGSGLVTSIPVPTSTVSISTNPKIFYLPLSISGSTVLTDWFDVPASDFYFNLTDYPGAKSVTWEAYLKSVNSPAKVNVRLYDVTNKRGVDYSDLSTQSATYVLLQSSAISIWRGNNLYRVQVKADNGTQADFGTGRIKVGY
jgi:hypothetical protein